MRSCHDVTCDGLVGDINKVFGGEPFPYGPRTQLGEIPLDIPPTELDHPRCPISTPIDLSRRGETHLTRSTRGGFADAGVPGFESKDIEIPDNLK